MFVSNAVLTQVLTPGDLDAYGDATAGTVAWTGRAQAYLRRPRLGGHLKGGQGADRENDQRVDELVLRADGTLLLALTSGDHAEASRVTVEDHRAATVERTYELVGLDARVGSTAADSIRLTLRREA